MGNEARLPPFRLGDYKLECKVSYREMEDIKNDPSSTIPGEESFLVNGVLPPQCSFHEEMYSWKISSARMRKFFYAFEIYRVFRKSMLNLDVASDDEARQQFRNRLSGRAEQLLRGLVRRNEGYEDSCPSANEIFHLWG